MGRHGLPVFCRSRGPLLRGEVLGALLLRTVQTCWLLCGRLMLRSSSAPSTRPRKSIPCCGGTAAGHGGTPDAGLRSPPAARQSARRQQIRALLQLGRHARVVHQPKVRLPSVNSLVCRPGEQKQAAR